MPHSATPPVRPDIFLSVDDFDVLSRLVGDMPGEGVAGLLQQELDRAIVCAPADLPSGAAPLNRWLHYVDSRSPEPRRIQIVLPHQADIDAGRVSVLSHVGAGLIGLVEGSTIAWSDPSGAERRLTPVMIEDPEHPADV
ncbi:GreA/GreB family elongation factor [Brevundimonas sp. SORGH_AS_0993]|uniref:GreA/GreB family elongation factor n=1 Tax=Brevundimonas sp. SORGH_AS_0993 TaxID=3041794 RepID=UPI002787607A|nr:GreA/GreB family elongation factor [Brevundimonas sp. SORGH_AS_0993]MDQ1154399.1 regulator of nucleoside diphosphate kinase [Brevundimonas sp. SORGH_AS_0993]